MSKTLLLNTFLRIFDLDLRLNILYWSPLVLASVMTVNNLFLSKISICLTILYVWTISFLKHLYSKNAMKAYEGTSYASYIHRVGKNNTVASARNMQLRHHQNILPVIGWSLTHRFLSELLSILIYLLSGVFFRQICIVITLFN